MLEVKNDGASFPNWYVEDEDRIITGPFRSKETAEKSLEAIYTNLARDEAQDERSSNGFE